MVWEPWRWGNIVAGCQELTTTSWEQSSWSWHWSSGKLAWSCWRNSVLTILLVIRHLKQIGKSENLSMWCLYEWTANQKKKAILKCCLLLPHYEERNNKFLDYLTCSQSGFLQQLKISSSMADWEEAPVSTFPKPNLHQAESWSLFGGLLVWSATASESWWNHQDLRSTSTNWRGTKICNTIARLSSQERRSFSQTSPIWQASTHQWAALCWTTVTKFASSAIFTEIPANWSLPS